MNTWALNPVKKIWTRTSASSPHNSHDNDDDKNNDIRHLLSPPHLHGAPVTFASISEMIAARDRATSSSSTNSHHPDTQQQQQHTCIEDASSSSSHDTPLYGKPSSATSQKLSRAFAQMEGAFGACIVSSGVAAINAVLLAFVANGDHVLVADGVYDPTRTFCDSFLSRYGVQVTYFDSCISPEGLEGMIRPNTKVCVCVCVCVCVSVSERERVVCMFVWM
jgi:cystathionine beta-lyase/cystathionine gamma-synthase